MEINEISVLGGFARTGEREPVERLDMRMGDVVSFAARQPDGWHVRFEGIAIA